jgi:hypothetical protein
MPEIEASNGGGVHPTILNCNTQELKRFPLSTGIGGALGGAETAATSIHFSQFCGANLDLVACGAFSAYCAYNNKRRYTRLGHTVCYQRSSNSLLYAD